MVSGKLSRLVLVLMMSVFLCATVFADEPVYKNIEGQWVTFDHLANPGYDEGKAIDIVYYPGTDNPAFNVTYQDVIDGNGIGFDNSSSGAARRTSVVAALNYIAGVLSGETGSADIHFAVSQTDGSGALASCGASYWVTNGYQGGFVFDHITTGSDPLPGSPDATAIVDFGYSWYAGSGTPGGSEYDLISVMTHEVTHALGFSSLIEYPSGDSAITHSNPGAYSYYDANLANGYGQYFTNATGGASYVGMTTDLTGVNGGVYFMGANAGASWGTGDPPIYAPVTWENGSSISHWNTTGTPITTIMRPAIAAGQTKRIYEDFEIGSLADIGYSVGMTTDLPATGPIGITALLAVLGMLMGVSRRRRR